LGHNDRSQKTVNSIFDDEENEVSHSKKEAFEIFRNELKNRTEKYTERTGRKLHKKTVTHLSAIVNFEKHHDMNDMQKVAQLLEEKLGTKVFQIAMHRDEGHVDDAGNPVKNYHAHIEFLGLDQEGQSVRRKLSKAMLSSLQTDVADLLGMERGVNYAKEQKPRPKRLDSYDFKEAKKREERVRKAERAKIKDIEAENRRLREELKESKATSAQYALLENEVRELKRKAREKDLTIETLQERVESFKRDFRKAVVEIRQNGAQIANLEQENETLKAENGKLKQLVEMLKSQVKLYKAKSKEKIVSIFDREPTKKRGFEREQVVTNDEPKQKPSDDDEIVARVKAENKAKREANQKKRGGWGMGIGGR
jgi:DNA repair exonuclease SbcCD ATPase subunit